MKNYVCPQCDDKARFKGLCRSCTEYNTEGDVVNAVRREEEGKHIHDENCGHNHIHRPTVEMFRQRRRPKLTKKQMAKYHQILTDNDFTEGTVDEARQILLNHGGEEE
jgi:predicted ATP-dependent serine protease